MHFLIKTLLILGPILYYTNVGDAKAPPPKMQIIYNASDPDLQKHLTFARIGNQIIHKYTYIRMYIMSKSC
jgi:hypothetical protein